MAGSMNKVTLIGNLGKDPEVRSTQGGAKIVSFNVATSENWTDKASGERKEKTEWHRVVIFNDRLGEIAEKYLHKGSKCYIEGAMRTRKWTDQSGVEKYTTEVEIGRFNGELILLDSRGAGEGGGAGPSWGGGQSSSRPAAAAKSSSASPSWEPPAGDLDDDIPF